MIFRELKHDVYGKRQKWNFCRLSSAVCTVEWNYLYLQWIVGDVIPFLCALFTDLKKRTQNQKSSLPFAVWCTLTSCLTSLIINDILLVEPKKEESLTVDSSLAA